jgi:phage baseplate assembly protein W
MQPDLGGNISGMLFENITPATLVLIQNNIRTTIDLYEPRAELIDVIASSNIDDNVVKVEIAFYITNVQQPITLDVFLERTR